jgi:CheY-like chemotaxis protein
MGNRVVLWIEDSAFSENTILATPVHMSGEYELVFALSATEGIQKLCERAYDAVIVDIRLPAGDDPRWIDMYYDLGGTDKAARLGIKLLEIVLGTRNVQWGDPFDDSARDRRRYGVLSVENGADLQEELSRIGVRAWRDKGGGDDPDVLLGLIGTIVNERDHAGEPPNES